MQKLQIREVEICEPAAGHFGTNPSQTCIICILGKECTQTRVLNEVALEGFNLVLYIVPYVTGNRHLLYSLRIVI